MAALDLFHSSKDEVLERPDHKFIPRLPIVRPDDKNDRRVRFGLPHVIPSAPASFGPRLPGVVFRRCHGDEEESDEVPEGPISRYYLIAFSDNRKNVCYSDDNSNTYKAGNYVLTEAVHGYDLGKVISIVWDPKPEEIEGSKRIVRRATQNEENQLPKKAEREGKALEMVRQTVKDMKLDIEVFGAEFQFDGKKWTFYYRTIGEGHVDCKSLAGVLFRIFGIRIWLVNCSDPKTEIGPGRQNGR
jgi:hypothetical protein